MTGLDTNVLVRYLTQDDPILAKANQLIEQTFSN
jgi:predicted nucleic-acid-binding protein